jgi:hypothetical protein
MSVRFKRGESDLLGIFFIAFIIFVLIVQHEKGQSFFSLPSFTNSTVVSSGTTVVGGSGSSASGTVLPGAAIEKASYPSLSLTSSNAPYEIQAYREYITVSNWGASPVDLTGWTLRNGKDKRAYSVGGQLQRFSADIAQIPKAAALLLPQGGSPLQDVVLKNGETAIITTGSPAPGGPYALTSFKENMCTGYLDRMDDYNFQPALQENCPSPRNEPGIENLDTACRMFVESLSPCGTPTFNIKDREGAACTTCVNGERLTSVCAEYIKSHFSYQGCIAYHASDPSFASGRTWRIYLGRSWEMWAENYETIELFDKLGNLAAFVNYR